MKKIHVIHENSDWTVHLTKQLDDLHLPYEEWFLDMGSIDLSLAPPRGVFYNRMSASSHTRGHEYGPELTGATLAWLERNGRTVFNGSRALQLEVSKVAQYMALNLASIRTPKTIAVVGKAQILEAAASFAGQPFITKHNRAGKGLGVRLFYSLEGLAQYVNGDDFEDSRDGITLLQAYIQAPAPFITRCEFIGGKFLYAVQVDTSQGFQLCPADACQIGDLMCPVGEEVVNKPKFQIIDGFDDPIIGQYEAFLDANEIAVAGIEFIRDEKGTIFTYDVNTNTNYNADAEAAAGQFGMRALAEFLGAELNQQ
jgi:hypothetical protein